MAVFLVKGESSEVRVEASNWLGALGVAIPQLGLSPGALGRLVCSVGADGSADACDPVTNVRVRIEPVELAPPPMFEMPAPDFEMKAPAPGYPLIEASMDEVLELEGSDLEALEEDPTTEGDNLASLDAARAERVGSGPAPVFEPTGVEEVTGLSDDRMEVVFERCSVISAAADVRSACAAALTIFAELVPADAGAVLVRTRSGSSLRFAAAFGPRAQNIIDTAIPIDQGIAGFAFGFGMGVVVEDVEHDDRHYARVDKASGYRTRSLVAVPLLSMDGRTCGVLELLNAPTRFSAEDMEIGRVVAGSLAEWLAPALG